MFRLSRIDANILSAWWWTIDRVLLGILLFLAGYGVLMVAMASPPVAVRVGLEDTHFIARHILVLVPAVIIMIALSFASPQLLWRLASVMMICALIGTALTLIMGNEIKGAQRWIHLPGFSLQPSEFIKPAFAIVAAWLMGRQREEPHFRGHILAAMLYGIAASLIMLQPDFGMTFVLTMMFAAQIFIAGLPFRYIFVLVIGLVIAFTTVYFSFGHVQSRIDRFLNPEGADTYQVDRAMDAFREGGILGTGPGQGSVKLTLPDAHADFIFAVVGEEMGLLFGLLVIGLFLLVMLRVLGRIGESDSPFIVYAVTGLVTMLGLQAFIHMGSSVHLLPTKGMTLPFISYGGSSLISVAITGGALLALTRRRIRRSIAQQGLMRTTSRSVWS